MKKTGGSFRGMCDMSGDYDNLVKIAKKAFKSKQLVDVEDDQDHGVADAPDA